MVHFGEFLKTCTLRSNSVTRKVTFDKTKIAGKYQNSKLKYSNKIFRVIFKQCETDYGSVFLASLWKVLPPNVATGGSSWLCWRITQSYVYNATMIITCWYYLEWLYSGHTTGKDRKSHKPKLSKLSIFYEIC